MKKIFLVMFILLVSLLSAQSIVGDWDQLTESGTIDITFTDTLVFVDGSSSTWLLDNDILSYGDLAIRIEFQNDDMFMAYMTKEMITSEMDEATITLMEDYITILLQVPIAQFTRK